MLSTIVGVFFMLSGGLLLIRPEQLRRKMQKKTVRTVKRYVFAVTCVIGALLVSAGWKYEGVFPKVLVVGGFLVFLKGVFLLRAKSAGAIMGWLVNVPAVYLRLYAVFQIGVGCAIAFGLGR